MRKEIIIQDAQLVYDSEAKSISQSGDLFIRAIELNVSKDLIKTLLFFELIRSDANSDKKNIGFYVSEIDTVIRLEDSKYEFELFQLQLPKPSGDLDGMLSTVLGSNFVVRCRYKGETTIGKGMIALSSGVASLVNVIGSTSSKGIKSYKQKKVKQLSQDGRLEKNQEESKTVGVSENTRAVSSTAKMVATDVALGVSSVVGSILEKAGINKFIQERPFLYDVSYSYTQIADAIDTNIDSVISTAKEESSDYASHKYGHSKASRNNNWIGVVCDVGETVLIARRVVNVKKLIKAGLKEEVKQK